MMTYALYHPIHLSPLVRIAIASRVQEYSEAAHGLFSSLKKFQESVRWPSATCAKRMFFFLMGVKCLNSIYIYKYIYTDIYISQQKGDTI